MIKKHLKTMIITSIIMLIPTVVGVILWSKLPEQLPMHWEPSGQVDGWMSKPLVIFALFPGLIALQWLCLLATSVDPKSRNITKKPMTLVLWIVPPLSLLVAAMTYLTALDYKLSVERIMPIFMGLVFVVIGNYLPKCKQSYTVGIRLPWTLDNEENWNMTHRFAGKVWIVGGLLGMACAFVGGFALFMVITFAIVIVPTVYSYLYFRKQSK